MAEEKGRVLLFGRRWSGRTTLANMLVSGEIIDLKPTDVDSICKTYVGRGWTVIDTMGFGEPLDSIASADEYAMEMGIDFLNEVRGSYSHIIFVLDGSELGSNMFSSIEEHRKHTLSMWKTFLEIFRGGEERFVILVTKVTPQGKRWPKISREVEERFPECKRFLFSNFFKEEGREIYGDDAQEVSPLRGEALEKLEKELEEMCEGRPWVQPNVANMGEDEIKEMAAIITQQLTTSWVGDFEWGMFDDSQVVLASISLQEKILKANVKRILKVRDDMENLGKEVKFYPRQCEYLLKRTQDAAKEIHDLVYGNEMNWDEDRCLRPLIKFLRRVESCMIVGKEYLCLFGENVEEHVILAMSCRTDLGKKSFSKFALVLRDLEWSLDLFRFWWHIVKAEGFTESKWASWFSGSFQSNVPEAFSATHSERQFWRSKFSWCEARRTLVYVGDGENGIAGTNFVESSVDGDNERHAQDQQDLISSMESHFQKPKKVRNRHRFSILNPRAQKMEGSSNSERSNYMSVLKNRLQGDLPLLQGDLTFQGSKHSTSSKVPRCFQIPGIQEYELIQLIGRGAFKEVFKCKWLGMNVALATFKSSEERASATDLEAEIEMLARVQHPNVVTLIGYSYDEQKQQGFLVTELLETSLEAMINKKMFELWFFKRQCPFSYVSTILILLQIVEAMIHVHDCGVIHRDLKPGNCLSNCKTDIFDGVEVKLTDLGSAEMGSMFKASNVGTRAYMAPEVYGAVGEYEGSLYTLSADVYSFGMTCYHIVTGKQPFWNMKPNHIKKMVCDGHRPVIPSHCPDELRELMTECWAHHAEDRPTFKDIQQRLWNLKLDYSISAFWF